MENEKEKQDEKEMEINEDFKLERILDNNTAHKYMFRICLIGNICVGKTSLLSRYSDNYFKQIYSATIGVDFRVITLKYKDIVAKVHVWDTAGQERFKSISINYYRSSNGFIYVYDITDMESLKGLDSWIHLTTENCNTNVINFLVGNKSDLENREVSKEEGEEFAKKNNLIFLETSAKNNDNVDIGTKAVVYEKAVEKVYIFGENYSVLSDGDFLIIAPGEGHMPGVCVNEQNEIHKAVFKVPVKK